jgi:hypothetical protein
MKREARRKIWFGKRGGGNSTVESRSSKAMVAGSNPVPRSKDSVFGRGLYFYAQRFTPTGVKGKRGARL